MQEGGKIANEKNNYQYWSQYRQQ